MASGNPLPSILSANSGVDIGDVDVLTMPGTLTDDATFTPGSGVVSMLGATFDDTSPDSVNEGDGGALRMSGRRELYIQLRDAAGNERGLNVDASGRIAVTGAAAGTEYNTNSAATALAAGTLGLVERDDALSGLAQAEGEWAHMRVDANGALWTHDDALDAALSGSELQVDVVASLPAGTNAIGKLAPNSGVDIGDVDVLSIAAGDNNIGNVDIVSGTLTTVSTVTNLSQQGGVAISLNTGVRDTGTQRVTIATNDVVPVSQSGTWDEVGIKDSGNSITVDGTINAVGSAAHGVTATGNPVLSGGFSQSLISSPAPTNRVTSAGMATRLATDLDGALFTHPHPPQIWDYHLNTSTAQTDATVALAAGAGLSNYVQTVVFSSGAATAINLFFEEGSTTKLGPWYLEAIAGRGMAVQFNPPKKMTANTLLTLTTSASIAHSVDVTGFISP